MNYNEALKYIDEFLQFGSQPGLERITKLLNLLGNPQDNLKFIHIAGTNGKGSTASYCSDALVKQGFKTGLYISPYVVTPNERLQINNRMIDDNRFGEIIGKVKTCIDKMDVPPTVFEIFTAAAMVWYCEEQCDIVVLETGLGGRFDATNVIKTPLACIITSISKDHTDYLGDTIQSIAYEKSGIIKQGVPVIIYPKNPPEAVHVIKQIAKEKDCAVIIPATDDISQINSNVFGNSFVYKNEKVTTKLSGEHQVYNAVTAIEGLMATGLVTKSQAINAIKDTVFAARCEVISTNPLVILDGSHNPDGTAALAGHLKAYKGKISAVFGMLKDKDIEESLSCVLPLCKRVYITKSSNPRSETTSSISNIAKKYLNEIYCIDNPKQAVIKAAADLAPHQEEILLCFGSLYLASEIRSTLQDIFSKEDVTCE